MVSLLSSLLLIVIATELVASLGKARIADTFYAVYARVAKPAGYKKQRLLKTEILQTKAELAKTSSQDEFAKWARLRRKVDKGIADLEKLNGQLSTQRAAFTAAATTALFLLTTVLPFIYTSWHRTSAVFYVPPGWFGPADRLLSLPFAPAGAVSCAAFGIVSRRAIKMISRTCVDVAGGLARRQSDAKEADTKVAQAQGAAARESKKEL